MTGHREEPMDLALREQVDPGAYKEGLGYATWCLCLVGLCGIHRIYLGKYGTGILYLLTMGVFGIGQLVDLFRMRRLVSDANIREGYLPHPRFVARLNGRQPPLAPPPAPPPGLRQRLVRAAQKYGGSLTVTQGVAETGLDFDEIEEELREMVASGYVDVDNAPDTGVVIYRFTELA